MRTVRSGGEIVSLFSIFEKKLKGVIRMVEMNVVGIALEPQSRVPLVFLRDKKNETILPILIGFFEAQQIQMKLMNEDPPRPMTYDLLKSILIGLNVKVSKILVNDLRKNTFFAKITLRIGNSVIEIDSRPSDAIALALRTDAPIYVDEKVIEEAGIKVDKTTEIVSSSDEVESFLSGIKVGGEEKDDEIGFLKLKLQKAVEREDYEEAALVRDEIRRLEREKKN